MQSVDELLRKINTSRTEKLKTDESCCKPRTTEDLCMGATHAVRNNLPLDPLCQNMAKNVPPIKPPELPKNTDAMLKRLIDVTKERIGLYDVVNRVYVNRTIEGLKAYFAENKRINSTLEKQKQLLLKKRHKWTKKADTIARKRAEQMIHTTRRVERDWQVLRGGAIDVTLLDTGAYERIQDKTCSESTVTRAKEWDKSQTKHRTVHNLLRKTVSDTIDTNIATLNARMQRNLKNASTTLTTQLNNHIIEATSLYRSYDHPLYQESEILQQDLTERGIPYRDILKVYADISAHIDMKHKYRLRDYLVSV